MAADPDAHAPAWVVVSANPPTVLIDGEFWLTCPVRGPECARVPRDRFGESWALDVLSVHVGVSHSQWR